jgi:hypothetical protein
MAPDDRVRLKGIGTGFIHEIRSDARGELIYTIFLDNPNATPTGLYYARRHELSSAIRTKTTEAA